MATSGPSSRPTHTSRRASGAHTAPTATSIARGATARSAVSPKLNSSLNGVGRRASTSRVPVSSNQEGDSASSSRESLLASLKRETEEKEELLVRIQNKDQSVTDLTKENVNLNTALNSAESRLTELYADQARIEEETVARLELVDRLRSQVQELEREKRDVLRRYNEQTSTFDAERQSYYDNEQHLKSRIQSLVQARKTTEVSQKSTVTEDGVVSVTEDYREEPEQVAQPPSNTPKPEAVDENEPAEMTSLRLELSTLSTSYASLQNTVQHLSSQLLDLKRVNNHLQEENESYNILLREKTLNGQFDILRTVGTKESDEGSAEEEEADDDEEYEREDQESIGSHSRIPLDPVDELAEDMDSGVYGEEQEQEQEQAAVQDEAGSISSAGLRERTRRMGRGGRRVATSSRSPPPKGESLADLPVAGPGLDLAAELGRAENQAILEGKTEPVDSRERSVSNPKGKRGKRLSTDPKAFDAKLDSTAPGGIDLDALRSEVKSLKDANKALSLYASKIIDRIIAQEGFEHVLAADYEKPPPSPVKKQLPASKKTAEEVAAKKKARPHSAIFGLAFPSAEPASLEPPTSAIPEAKSPSIIVENTATTRTQRRSLSFDWRSFSMFGSSEKKPDTNPNLRPLNLRPGVNSVVGARKLDTFEDEEDKRERERLNAVMKLMGIEKPESSAPPSPAIGSPNSFGGTPSGTPNSQSDASPNPAQQSRFSFFRTRSNTSDNSVNTTNSAPAGPKSNLTAEALEHAEAETTLAALDEREKTLSAEIAKGSNGGFTELPSRRQRGDEWRSRSKQSRESGSGSTVWSAGMSTHREEDSGDEGPAHGK